MDELWNNIVDRLQDFFDPVTLSDLLAEAVADLVVSLVVFGLFWLFWRVVNRLLKGLLRRTRLDRTATSFIETVVKFGYFSIALIYTLGAAGIDTSAVLASLGIAGLTIGFAARDALSNVISGVLIFLDRPFVIGDLVEIEDRYGRVDRITLRSTRVVTRDGKMLAVPNTEIINKTVISYTNFPHLRLDVDVTVGVSEDLGRVRQLLLDLVADDPDYLSAPPPRIAVTGLNDYNVALQLQVWLDDETKHIEKRFELREGIFVALTTAGVDMPFETIQLRPVDVSLEEGAADGEG
ncbi:MAG: mechanosensitive ion channel family protein [Candidatus Promineifilaceae bacterium]|nr:mechanosensitive ion channel family protein [Candidatus Promineifilaceae bacterium]